MTDPGIMCAMSGRRKRFPLVIALSLLVAAMAACDDDAVAPVNVPDIQGAWSGQYRVTGCGLSGATDPFFCADVFFVGASLILDLNLDQSGENVTGTIDQGLLPGEVDGTVDENGVLILSGVIGGPAEEATTTILAWQTGVVGDSLFGSWRFSVEDNTGSGFGIATVDANLRMFGPSVLTSFGCAVEGTLAIDGQLGGSLGEGDCQLADASFFDAYAITGSVGDSIEITLRSIFFDAFLIVNDLDDEPVAADDDSGLGPDSTDASVIVVFDVGATLLLIANSFQAGESGPYTLSAVALGPGGSGVLDPAPRRIPASTLYRVEKGGRLKQSPSIPAHRASVGRKLTTPRGWRGK